MVREMTGKIPPCGRLGINATTLFDGTGGENDRSILEGQLLMVSSRWPVSARSAKEVVRGKGKEKGGL